MWRDADNLPHSENKLELNSSLSFARLSYSRIESSDKLAINWQNFA